MTALGLFAQRHGWAFGRIALVSLVVPLVVLAGGAWLFTTQEHRLKHQAEDDLAAIARFKINQIENWQRERLGDAFTVIGNPFLRQNVQRFLDSPGSDEEQSLRALFEGLRTHDRYKGIRLVDADRKVRLHLGVTPSPSPEADAAMDLARAEGRPVFTDIHQAVGDDDLHLDIVAPLFAGEGSSGRFLGWVALQTSASQFLFPLLQTWPTHSRTAETLLIRRDGDDVLFLNELRHRQGTALTLRIPVGAPGKLAVQAVQGARGLLRALDYRGVDVLGVVIPVPDTPWLMISKMDADEVYAAWRQQALYIAALVVCLLAGVGAAAFLLRQHGLKTHFEALYQAEARLRDSLELQAITLRSIGDAVISTDLQGRVALFNAVAERLTGWSAAEAAGRPLAEVFHIIHEQTRARQENPLDRVLAEGRPVELAEHTLLKARDGSERPIADSAAPIRDGRGELVGVVLIFRDNSAERAVRLAEAALRHSREDLKRAQAVAMTGSWRLDVANNSLTWSDEAYRIFGIASDTAMTYESFLARVHPDDRARVDREWAAALRGDRYDLEHRIVVDGDIKWVRERAVLEWDQAGNLRYGFGVVQDITELKNFERFKALNEARGKALLELAAMHDASLDELTRAMLDKAVVLTESAFGYLQIVQDDSAQPRTMQWSRAVAGACRADTPGHAPVAQAGIWADCLRTGQPALHNDYAKVAGLGALPPGHIPLVRHLSVPIVEGGHYRAVLGVGDKQAPYDAIDVSKLQGFAADAWQIVSRRKAEAALRESEAFSRAIIENSPDCIKVLSRQGELVFMSQGGLRLLGLEDTRGVYGKPYLDFWEGSDHARARAAFEEARQGRVGRFDGFCPTRDGTPKWWDVSISPVPGPGGEASSFLVISRDDTQRKLAADALRESEERFRQLVESAPDAIFVQIEGRFAYVNKACLELYGLDSPEAMLGTPILARFHPDFHACAKERMQALVELRQAQPLMEQRHLRADGSPLDVEVSAVPLCHGGKNGALVFVRDIAERKRLDALREDMDRIARHDLKAPLNAILGLPQLILMDDNITADQRQFLHHILDAGYKMLGLVNLSMDLFHMERGTYELTPEKVDLPRVVGKALADLERISSAKRLTTQVALAGRPVREGDVCLALAEELLCYSMFSNLLKNALEASPEGGRVTVNLTRDQGWRIDIRNPGEVPGELRERFFDKYATMGKAGGTGLGTYSARLMAATMGGGIALDASEAGATTVTVWLPATV